MAMRAPRSGQDDVVASLSRRLDLVEAALARRSAVRPRDARLVEALREAFGDEAFTATDALRLAAAVPTLRDTLDAARLKPGKHALAHRLRAVSKREPVGGWRLVDVGRFGGERTWAVEPDSNV